MIYLKRIVFIKEVINKFIHVSHGHGSLHGHFCIRSSQRRRSIRKGVLKSFTIFTEKHLSWSLYLIKLQVFRLASLQVYIFIKIRLQHRCFPLNVAKILRTPILKNTCVRLLLCIYEAYLIISLECIAIYLSYTLVKLGELVVLSIKVVLKMFGKIKFRPIGKMHI